MQDSPHYPMYREKANGNMHRKGYTDPLTQGIADIRIWDANFEDTNVLASFWDGQEKAREQLYKYRENLKYLGKF